MDPGQAVNRAAPAAPPGRATPDLPMSGPDFSRIRSMAVMQGDLRDYALPELLQFLQTLRKKGQLLIERKDPQQSAGVYFAGGRVVHAFCPPAHGEEAIYHLLQWRQGRFMFLADAVPEAETIHTDLRNLLLEGMRLLDELPDVHQHLPAADTVLHLERDSERIAEVRVNVRQWRLLANVNGRRTVADLIAMSDRDPVDVSRDIYHLLMVGLVSERHHDAFLGEIVATAVAEEEWPGTPSHPLPILSGRILLLADGRRTLLEIREALRCTEQDLIEEFKYLVRTGRLRLLDGHRAYDRFLR